MTTTEELLGLAQALMGPLLEPLHRVFAPFLLTSLLLAVVVGLRSGARLPELPSYLFPRRLWLHRSALVDYQLCFCKGLLRWAGVVPWGLASWGLAAGLVSFLDAQFGIPDLPVTSAFVLTALYSTVLFLVWDSSRYVLHRLLHQVPFLWRFHQVHHSAEVLTPLTFYRSHPVEASLYWLRGVLTTGCVAGLFFWAFRGQAETWQVVGVHGLGFLFNLAGGNLRHSHVWLSWGRRLEHLFISPAQHQIHHSREATGCGRNFGSWLAIWDWMGGTLSLAGPRRRIHFGLRRSNRNHAPDSLLSALLDPFVDAFSWVRPSGVVALIVALLLSAGVVGPTLAEEGEGEGEEEESEEEESEEEESEEKESEGEARQEEAGQSGEPAGEVRRVREVFSVIGERAGPVRVAGSAHKLDQAQLERREQDDIHELVKDVPGVYVRGEDGYGLRPNIGLRGAAADRSAKVTLMEDGVLLAPAPYSAPAAYYFPMTTRMVGVEVFKGAAATRHGPNTVGGAINLLTRPIPDDRDLQFDFAYGLRNSWKLHGWGGGRGKRGGFLLEGVHASTSGFKELGEEEASQNTGFDKTEFMFKGRLHTGPTADLFSAWELKLGYAHEDSRETYLGLTDDDFQETPYRRYSASSQGRMQWHRTQAELRWQLAGAEVNFELVGYHHWQERTWTKLSRFRGGPDLADVLAYPDSGQSAIYSAILRGEEDTSSQDQQLIIGTNARTYHSAGVQGLGRWDTKNDKVQSSLQWGFRIHGDQVERLHTEDPFAMTAGHLSPIDEETVTATQNLGSTLAFSAHVHEELGLGPIRLLPGLRLEVIRGTLLDRETEEESTATRAVLLPGFGFYGQATPWLGVLAGVHRGFSPVAPGQPDEVKPEESWNVEAGLRASHRGFSAEAIGFFNDYNNLTGQCTLSSGCPEDLIDRQHNGGAVFVYGVEALVSYRASLPAGLTLEPRFSYTWTGSRFQTSFESQSPHFGSVREGDSLAYVPEHRGAGSLALQHDLGGVELSVSGQSEMRDMPGQGGFVEGDSIPALASLSLNAQLRLTSRLQFYVTLTNLTNEAHILSRRPYGVRPGRPFHAMFGFKLDLRGQGDGVFDLLRARRAKAKGVTPTS